MSSPVALVAVADQFLRKRIGCALTSLRWQVIEMSGGAETLNYLETAASMTPLSEQALILDKSLPDLDIFELFQDVESSYPHVDMVSLDGSLRSRNAPFSSRRGEIMHAIRTSLEVPGTERACGEEGINTPPNKSNLDVVAMLEHQRDDIQSESKVDDSSLPGFYGRNPAILEVSRRVRLVASRRTPVLVQGSSGTGKELVARATHCLSNRSEQPFIVLNCAAIPESLFESELFGHTRGAFTGANQKRVGRIESANGGTLFLDEIGEMPLTLQAKLLRFLESGEIQRVGENETQCLDVRVIAATHQHLATRSRQGSFREDLFHRLAVFTIRTPTLVQHAEDIPLLANLFLKRMCPEPPVKTLDSKL